MSRPELAAWRLFIALAGYLYSPEQTDQRWDGPIAEAVCIRSPAHKPPVKSCSCGVHAALDGRALARYCQHAPYPLRRRRTLALVSCAALGDVDTDAAQSTFRGAIRAEAVTLRGGAIYVAHSWAAHAGVDALAARYDTDVKVVPSIGEWLIPAPDPHPLLRNNWVRCGEHGEYHWGRVGAAGVLLLAPGRRAPRVLLALRSRGTQHKNTWGLPGGAKDHADETAAECAMREAGEEVGLDADDVTIVDEHVAECAGGRWAYTTIVGTTDTAAAFRPMNVESQQVEWVDLDHVDRLHLHPGLAEAWPQLRKVACAAASEAGLNPREAIA